MNTSFIKYNDLLDRFISFVHQNNLFTGKDRLLVAVSGGVDSVVLCHLCKRAGYDFGIAHCNFQLRAEDSTRDEKFVQALAGELGVPFYLVQFETKQYAEEKKQSTQEAARELRYKWFEKTRAEEGYDFILTAHHADDNIETVLMNFFRGTGITGLTGIKPINRKIRRPLLFAKRTQLEAYLKEHQLQFVQDETNLHDDYTRNYFRNTILPQISNVYPEVQQNLLNNMERFKDVEALYRNEIEHHQKKLLQKKGADFLIPVLLLQKTTAYQTVLLEMVKAFGFKASQLPELIGLLESQPGKYMLSSTHRVLKDRKHLVISALNEIPSAAVIIEGEGRYIFAGGILSVRVTSQEDILRNENTASINASLVEYPLILRPWRTGDYFYPLGMQKKKKVSRFLIDKKLSLAEKERIWVVEMNKKIIWVVGHRIDDRFKITGNTTAVLRLELL
ncbi:MAG TPA: tRNA lysidine(34) synthetase TilS [Niabella sp.]|nr:tRNA lysidine(34) synthetase TilS [Niabella sp.]